MDLFTGIEALLATGADAATIALLIVMWRFDRRLLRLETTMSMLKYGGKHHEKMV